MVRTILKPPAYFCISSSILVSETINFLNQLERKGFANTPILLDLSEVTYISAPASLLLFSCVSNIQLQFNSPNMVRCRFPKAVDNPEGYRLIVQTGLSRALSSGDLKKLDDLTFCGCFFQSSADPDTHCTSTAKLLTESLSVEPMGELALTLTAALSEAMLNVLHHAYVGDTELQARLKGNRWWQCAWFDKLKGRFVFIIHDMGQGISNTYKMGKHKERQLTESQLIEEALSPSGTRFQETHRGNGSEDIKAPVGIDETLLVYSGNVIYSYQGDTGRARMQTLSARVPGTLIQWSLAFQGGQP